MIIVPCAQCGISVKVPPSKQQRQQRTFCSNACYDAFRSVYLECKHCGKTFHTYKSVAQRRRYCSKECQRTDLRYGVQEERACTVCGTVFCADVAKNTLTCSRECAHIGRAQRSPGTLKPKIIKTCETCGKRMELFASRARSRFCSQACKGIGLKKSATGKIRTSKIIPCLYCGKPTKQFKSREDERPFCNSTCFHAWDAVYKSSPEMLAKLASRLQENVDKTSKLEDRVADWLSNRGLEFTRQVLLKVYIIDFVVNGVYVEVHGCYWHGCPLCNESLIPRQRKRIARDKSLTTYCKRRNIPLIVIWEHDIRRNNFAALATLTTTPLL
jgi:endogenous inhibitor of DNA gyrase (YacG/DUF329 family)/G:T-mismatch repair DNA endonuclease (very short patch repair protein)